MSNIHPHQANGEDFLMVEVPRDAVCIVNTGMGYITYKVTDHTDDVTDKQIERIAFTGIMPKSKRKITDTHGGLDVKPALPIKLPSGTYTILGLGSELSEEQKVMIVDGQFDTFLDYQSPSVGGFIFDTSQESLSSLCTSKGMQLKHTLFIKKEK